MGVISISKESIQQAEVAEASKGITEPIPRVPLRGTCGGRGDQAPNGHAGSTQGSV